MFKLYYKIAIRALFRQKVLSGINILGLSIGIACFSLSLLYAINELNFDRFHANGQNIYRVYRSSLASLNTAGENNIYTPMPMAPAMKLDIPEMKNFVRMQEGWNDVFVRAGENISLIPVTFADPSFFDVFSFKLKSGTRSATLKDLHNVVLSEKTAKKLFGAVDPVGKAIEIKVNDTYESFIISGVAENTPSNSSIDFDILASFEYFATTRNGTRSVNNWSRSNYLTYIQLQPGSNLNIVNKKLQSFYKKYYPNEAAELRQQGKWKGEGYPSAYRLQPLLSMHTDTRISGGKTSNVDPANIWILLCIAGAVLLIACINFTTLAIGRSASRAKEIGIRKVIGSGRKPLAIQFISEAMILSVLSATLGLLIAKSLLPYFNQLSGRELLFSFKQFPELIWLIALLIVIVGLFAGSYPALILSGFNPTEVLKQKIKVGGSNIFSRSLVTLQFVLSVGLIASTAIILKQINYMTAKYPGFNKENIIVINGDDADTRKIYPLFKNAVHQQSKINAIASSEFGLGEGSGSSQHEFQYEGKNKQVLECFVDKDYIPLMGIQLLAGRNFNSDISADTVTSVIINEAMVQDFGWTAKKAIGRVLKGYYGNGEAKLPVVVGVVKNLNFHSFREEVKPQMFHQFAGYTANRYFISIKPGNPSNTLASIEAAWKKLVPELPFRYSFLDEDINRFYKTEKHLVNIIGWTGGISIFLACLGLFGLASLAAVNRTKEIGIRKVLGASIANVTILLSKDFLKLIIVAITIASPIAWYFMNNWLQDFAYRITIEWWMFALTGLLTIGIAFMTLCYQSIKAALINPVQSLRSE